MTTPLSRPPILLISLSHAAQRRRLMSAQLELPDMPPHRLIDAVDGRKLTDAERGALYDAEGARAVTGRELTPPEIGCALSHLAAYRRMVDESLPLALVLEDDALLGHQFLKVLDRVVPLVDHAKPQAILLSHVGRYSAWGGRRVDKTHGLYRPYVAFGAHAYLITLLGAKAMLDALQPVRAQADDWGYFMEAGVLDVRAVIPYIVGTAPLASASQIGEERFAVAKRTGLKRWVHKYLWQKLVFQLFLKPALRLRKLEDTW